MRFRLFEDPSQHQSELGQNVRRVFNLVNALMRSLGDLAVITDHNVPEALRQLLESLTDEEKNSFIQIIKSITLLTSGAVDVVRARGTNFDQTDRTEWVDITSEQSNYLLYKMGFDFYSLITAEDYAIAHDLLQIHSGRSNFQSMSSITGVDPSEEYSIELLYRGLNSMSSNVLKHLIASDVVTIGVPSSSSTSMKISESFANKGDPWRIMLVIKNPNHIGLDAETLSFYEKEKEVIISGTIKVETIELKDMRFTNETKFSAQAGDVSTNENKRKMLEVINAEGNDRVALIRRLGITSPSTAIWVFTGTIE